MMCAALCRGFRLFGRALVLPSLLALIVVRPAAATSIERIVSPKGIEAWLVREPSVPLLALNFAFKGGANEDPAGKTGVANMTASLLDEGAGELDAAAFQEQIEGNAIDLGFQIGHDYFHGSLRTLNEHRDAAFNLLRLALTSPRFDKEAIERIRTQILIGLKRETTNPNDIANRRWWEVAFPNHPYGQAVRGTPDSLPQIGADDLKAYTHHVFARDNLKIAMVGDIDAATAGRLIDQVFGALPQKAKITTLPPVRPQGLGQRIVINLDVPQSVIVFGGNGVARNDPDFIPAFVVNHILGGGSFSSRLYREVREKRGLVYSIRTGLIPLNYTALLTGGTATRSDRTTETLDLIDRETHRLAQTGPTEQELADAKSFLKGSYALNFDTSSKIAEQLVQIQLDRLGIDYIDRRAGLIDAVTLADVKRVAKRLLEEKFLVTVVGRSKDLTEKNNTTTNN